MMSSPSHQTVRLSSGSHRSPAGGVCVMELASMLAGEPFSDRPRSVCPVVASYLRALNDSLDDVGRQSLFPYASSAVGTAGGLTLQRRRAERCRDTLRAMQSSHGRVRRIVATALGTSPELQPFGAGLVRAFRRSGPGWEHRALAFADELIAMSVAEVPPRRHDPVVSLMTDRGGRANRRVVPGG
jgi:hypothetical protein